MIRTRIFLEKSRFNFKKKEEIKMTKAIDAKQELMRQHMISQLLDLGIREDGGKSVHELDYHSVRLLLVKAKLD